MLPKLIGFHLDGTCLLSPLSWVFSAQSWVRTHSSINQFSVCTCWRDLTPQWPDPGRLGLNLPPTPTKEGEKAKNGRLTQPSPCCGQSATISYLKKDSYGSGRCLPPSPQLQAWAKGRLKHKCTHTGRMLSPGGIVVAVRAESCCEIGALCSTLPVPGDLPWILGWVQSHTLG